MSEGMKKIEQALDNITPADDTEQEIMEGIMRMLALLVDRRAGAELVTVLSTDTHEYHLTVTRKRIT